jgi:hypothetical protein
MTITTPAVTGAAPVTAARAATGPRPHRRPDRSRADLGSLRRTSGHTGRTSLGRSGR